MSRGLYGIMHEGQLLRWNDVDAWVEKAVLDPSYINIPYHEVKCMTVFDGYIYIGMGGISSTSRYPLHKWNGGSFQIAVDLKTTLDVLCFAEFDGNLYAGCDLGRLRKLGGGATGFDVVATYGTDNINALVVLNDKLYAITDGLYLLEFNGVDTLTPVGSIPWGSLEDGAVFNNKIYTGHGSYLYYWNGEDSLIEVCNNYIDYISCLYSYDGYLYNGGVKGDLLRNNGTGDWVKVADYVHYNYSILRGCMREYSGELFAGDSYGALLKWNGSNAWIEVAPLAGPYTVVGLRVFTDPIIRRTKAWIM